MFSRLLSGLHRVLSACKGCITAFVKIDPQKALHRHYIFWLPVFVAGTVSLIAGITTAEFGLEHLAYPKRTMDALAYPLFILSFALPVVLAVGRFHASAQRAESIRISNSTMSFKHYFDHRDAFSEYLRQIDSSTQFMQIRVIKPFILYEVFFPNSKMTSFDTSPSNVSIELIDVFIRSLVKKAETLKSSRIDMHVVTSFFDSLGLVFEIDIKKIEEAYGQLSVDTQPAAIMVRLVYELLEHLCEFDRDNSPVAKTTVKRFKNELLFFSGNNELNNKIRFCINREISKNNPLLSATYGYNKWGIYK
ncbi:hypothetical protein ACE414_07380 [Alteromonas macleodii]|uniref:hypothetical protein n=1 Tax=Alteromonas macleodii TaxID=28108 RepID=UPI0036553305